MDGNSNRDNASLFFSGKKNDELAQKLLALHATIKNTPAAPQHDHKAFDDSEALSIRDALVIEKELALARVRLDTSFQSRRPHLVFANPYPGDGTDRLARDTSGHVYARAYDHISLGCAIRQSLLL